MLTPTGNRKCMVAQSYMNEDFGEKDLSLDDIDFSKDEDENQTKNEKSVSEFVFDFLVGLKYPPRRLEDKKNKFVTEEGGPDGSLKIDIKLPDQVYGEGKSIPRNKLQNFVKDVENNFGLKYQTYKRSDGQIDISFSSSEERSEENEIQENDILDKIYGTGSSEESINKSAYSMPELIKLGKNQLFYQLMEKLK